MQWKKLGRIFSVAGQADWMRTHAAVPIAEQLDGDTYRIYFTTRDNKNRSHVGYVDINIFSPQDVLNLSTDPVLAPGAMGEFDDSGAMASWITQEDGVRYFYYQGWNLGVTVPFRNSIGLAISSESKEFRRFAAGPIVDRSMTEPHFTATPCVIVSDGIWRMWYLSCTEWTIEEGSPKHRYHIKYAESDDGISWRRDGRVAIDYSSASEYAISRPSVIRDPDCWRMWYSHRGPHYRIGYAQSPDGINWTRMDDKVGIDRSVSGWDSEMIEYPFVFDHAGLRYMLYNGNDYGRSGFGLAVLSDV